MAQINMLRPLLCALALLTSTTFGSPIMEEELAAAHQWEEADSLEDRDSWAEAATRTGHLRLVSCCYASTRASEFHDDHYHP